MTQKLLSKTTLLSLAALLIFMLAFTAAAWRLDKAPDVFVDEILYTRIGTRVAATGEFVWDNGRPLAVHPPLYFLVKAVYLQLTGNPNAQLNTINNIFQDVYHARYLNVFFAALTASLFFWIGLRLKNFWLGLLLAILFLLDPFGLRINRRAMLETMSGFLMLAGMGVILVGLAGKEERLSLRRAVAGGTLLGLAMLAKDLAFTAPLALLLFGLWEWRRGRQGQFVGDSKHYQPAFLATAVAASATLLFPLWVLLVGNWSRFVDVKLLALQRLVGVMRLTGWNRPGVSLVDLVLQRMADYGPSYLLLALGGLVTICLFRYLFFSNAQGSLSASGRFLAIWGLVLYPFYAFIAIFGGGNDHYFYFLLLPAFILVGYSLTITGSTRRRSGPISLPRLQLFLVGLLLLIFLPYNLSRWFTNYIVGHDNGYYHLAAYVNQMVPPEATLNASGDRLKFNYFFPSRPITHAATPQEAQEAGAHYFVLVPRDIQARHGRVTPELAAWLMAHGERLFEFEGNSFGPIYLYRVDYPEQRPPQGDIAVLTIASPEGAPLGSFLLLLALWSIGLGGLTWWLRQKTSRPAYSAMEMVSKNV